MTRRRKLPPKTQRPARVPDAAEVAPSKQAREVPVVVTPAALAAATTGSATPTSLTLAAAIPVERTRYTEREVSAATHAMDYNTLGSQDALSFVQATGWPGFPTLALLAQLPEYRTMHETLADEAVRTWGKVTCASDDEQAADKIVKLTQALERFGVRSLLRQAVIHDQAFGGAHIFPRLRLDNADVPPDAPLLLSPKFVKQGCLESFVAVEPYWVTPNDYNATDPTKPNFYKPSSWYMLSHVVSASRLYTFVSRPVSDMLKAAYSFRGVSMSQMAMPYVDNWLRTRQSVSDTVKQFSITYFKTDMAQALTPGGNYSLDARVQLFNLYRDNRNAGIVDMSTEDIAQINTPLSGLDALQAQSQEQMAAVSHIPLVKLTGITPAGLNANSDGEIRVWYDYVAGYQSHNLTPLMTWIIKLIQLSEFGEIDPGLSWEWAPLYELTALEEAELQDKKSITAERYVGLGVVSPEMVQQKLNDDPDSGYAGVLSDRDELDEVAELAEKMLADALRPAVTAPEPEQEEAPTRAEDAEWKEADHPRADNGQFGSGGAGSSGSPEGATAATKTPKAKSKRTPTVKLREGHQRVSKPFPVFKDDWGDYIASHIPEGTLPKRGVTVQGGMVVGMLPGLARNTNTEVEGEIQPKSDATVAKEAAKAAELAAKEAATKAAARNAVFQLTLNRRFGRIPAEARAQAQTEINAALRIEGTASERIDAAEVVLARYGV